MTNKSPTIIPEEISLNSVNIFKALLQTSDEYLENPQKIEAAEFNIAKDIGYNLEKGGTRYRLFFSMNSQDNKGQPLGVKVEYGIEFHFQINNFKAFTQESKEGGTQIDANLAATLLGIAYSTSRGIIFERTRGTFFDGLLLPVIDPYKLLHDKA